MLLARGGMKNAACCLVLGLAVGFAACGGTSSKSDGGPDGAAGSTAGGGRGGTTGAGGGAGSALAGRGGGGGSATGGANVAGTTGSAGNGGGAGGAGGSGAAGAGTAGTAGSGGRGGTTGTAGGSGDAGRGGSTGSAGIGGNAGGGAGRGGTNGSAGSGGAGATGSGGATGTAGSTGTAGAGGTPGGRCTVPGDCGAVAPGVGFCAGTTWSCVEGVCIAECMGGRTCTEAPDSGCLLCRTASSTTPMSQGCVGTACAFQAGQVGDVQHSSGCQASNTPDFSTWSCTGRWARLADHDTRCTIQDVATDAIRYSISCGSCVTVVTISHLQP